MDTAAISSNTGAVYASAVPLDVLSLLHTAPTHPTIHAHSPPYMHTHILLLPAPRRSPAPGEPAFVKEGDTVKKGQTVGIIEAMKLMNEIEAEVGGTVIKLLVDNGQAVTPGMVSGRGMMPVLRCGAGLLSWLLPGWRNHWRGGAVRGVEQTDSRTADDVWLPSCCCADASCGSLLSGTTAAAVHLRALHSRTCYCNSALELP